MSTTTLQPSSHQSSTVRPGSVRLTRRGRLVVLALALGLLLLTGFALATGSVATSEAGAPEPTQVVVVGSGDTLWDIAAEAAAVSGTDDVRDMVGEIQELNGLESGMLQAGQDLRVPLG